MKECLKELQEKYVSVPADKSANYIIVVCKRYYFEVICTDLGLWPGARNSYTCFPEIMDPKEISGNHISYVKSLRFEEDCMSNKLPSFYWTPIDIINIPHFSIKVQNLCSNSVRIFI